ncbi:glycosyltransferase family 87 protein [Sphingomonas cavernae]|uniref:DUF2029 domain-containing protein n=1 Tax=Sphingomonas cavernae TaxID=2320861 RepID=A0A418WR04_9SPHN|nr:glycosyltransferase family 87 protein [Sphingomonas cavernae]RJF93694.1 DUF2029 domain-containing protein [Sphingomonas cavernae]
MIADRLRPAWKGLTRLLGAFGIYGLIMWPLAGWLAYDLIAAELANLDGIRINASTVIGRDFVNIWHGGAEVLRSGAAGIYDRPEYRRTLEAAIGARGIYAYSYPPHMLLFSVPFGLLGYVPALILWQLGGLILLWHAARPWLRDVELPGVAVLLLSGTIVNLWAAHFGFLTSALALYGWRAAGSNARIAGLSFALMSVKPHMGILVPVILAMKRDVATMFWATLGVLALALLSVCAFGISAWQTWLGSTLAFQASLMADAPGREFIFMMPTVGRALQALTGDAALIALGQLISALFAIGVVVWAWRRNVGIRDLGLLSFAATALILPYFFNYDLIAFSLVALICAVRWRLGWYAPERLVYGAAFLVPLAQAPLAHMGIWLSPLAIAALLASAGWRMGRDADREAT